MAHFAQLDGNNVVTQVIVVSNDDTSDSNGVEVESIGVAFCQKLLGGETNWKQTSYNNTIRGNYAGIGYTYMSNVATLGVGATDIFINQKPHASWTISATAAQWEPPSTPGAAPALTSDQQAAGSYYVWNESNYQADPSTAWVLTTPE
tara:strand:- start:1249 stop:1692 length:444 start_codon:yes stop_codon:yes gene_type:complete